MLDFNKILSWRLASKTLVLSSRTPLLDTELYKNKHLEQNHVLVWDFVNAEIHNIKKEEILRDFLKIPKRITSKTQQFCKASFKNGKSSVALTASCCICVKCCACHEEVRPGYTKCCTCDAESSSQTWRSDAPKCNQPFSGNLLPDLP